MWDIFKAEVQRFRSWAISYAVLHLVVMGFLARMVDMAQQPERVYQVIGAVYTLTGLLIGLYQMGGYRRPNAWLNLLHRPIPHPRIALALLGTSGLLLAVAVLLPTLVIASWQETMTTRVLDSRHVWLCVSGWLLSLCGYLIGAYAMLANRRHAYAGFVFLLWLGLSRAVGMGMIAVQCMSIAWLLVMVLLAFKPDLSQLTQGLRGGARTAVTATIFTALPLQLALWFGLLMLGVGIELIWIMQGSHPNNLAVNPPNSVKAANSAEPRELMLLGLQGKGSPDLGLWREQAAISDVNGIQLSLAFLPVRDELTNIAPMEFDDEERRVRWVFSHDSMHFEGYGLTDFKSAGTLGVAGDAPFVSPPLPRPGNNLITRDAVYQYDSEAKLVLPRLKLPAGEIMSGFDQPGDRLVLLSDKALYFYDARDLQRNDGILQARQRMPLPGHRGNLTRVASMELVDGYLVTFLFTYAQHNADGDRAYQATLRVDEQGKVTQVARREPDMDYTPLWRYQNWYVAPLLYRFKNFALDLLSGYTPAYDDRSVARVPSSIGIVAFALSLLSLLAAGWRTARVTLSPTGRLAWIVACGVLSVPAVMSLWLMYPPRARAG
jgi:hypothetical protein